MKTVQLSNGNVALVDDEDYERVSQLKWHALVRKHTVYAQANRPKLAGKRHTLLMHRLIIGAKKGQEVDHKDGDGLNNQKINLRICTRRQNLQNQRPFRSKTGFKGVRLLKRSYTLKKPYLAEITVDGNLIDLGRYADAREAAQVYNQAAISAFGSFARLNLL